MGHVLAQTHDQSNAIQRFADIIAQFASVECLLVAVDAKGAAKSFRTGWERLRAALVERSLEVDVKHAGRQKLVANITGGGGHARRTT